MLWASINVISENLNKCSEHFEVIFVARIVGRPLNIQKIVFVRPMWRDVGDIFGIYLGI